MASKATGLEDLWQPLCEEIVSSLGVDAGSVMVLNQNSLVRKAAVGISNSILKEPPLFKENSGYSWQAIESGNPVVVEKIDESKIASEVVKKEKFASLVTIPMISRKHIVGVVSVFTKSKRNFSVEELKFFSTIANQAATAIISIQAINLLSMSRQRVKELEALNQISRSITTLFDFDETIFSILALISKTFEAPKTYISVFDHLDKSLKAIKPAHNITDAQIAKLCLRSDQAVTGQVFCKGVPIIQNELDKETREIYAKAGLKDVTGVMAAPLKVKSQTLGVLHALSLNKNEFLPEDLQLFNILSSQVGVLLSAAINFKQTVEQKNKDEALLESIGEGVFAVDNQDKIILMNKSGEKITGFLSEEVIGKKRNEALPIFDVNKQPLKSGTCPLNKTLDEGKKQSCSQIFLKRKDGFYFPSELSAAPIYNADNLITGSIIVFKDISKELEIEQLKQELFSIATHELRTPITAINGYVDMILDGDTGQVNKETYELVEEIHGINNSLADLVDDLLNVSRIEQGRIEIKSTQVNLSQTVKAVLDELAVSAKEKDLSLIFTGEEEISVKADPDKLRQILVNLVGNAIKYTPQGKVEIKARKDSNQAVISVKDTGIGISPDQVSRLFEKFYRVRTEQTRNIPGTGLGLWITKKLVEMMGGKISVESVANGGSTFIFNLPLG